MSKTVYRCGASYMALLSYNMYIDFCHLSMKLAYLPMQNGRKPQSIVLSGQIKMFYFLDYFIGPSNFIRLLLCPN